MKKTVCLILAFLMLAGGMISCSSGTENSDDDANSVSVENDTAAGIDEPDEEPEDIYVKPELEERNFEGETFTFYARYSSTNDGIWSAKDLVSEGMTGEQINDAVFQRQTYLEDTYNYKIAMIESGTAGGMNSNVQKYVTSGDTSFQVVVADAYDSAAMSTSGSIYDLNDIPNIDLTQRWWSQSLNSSMSIAKHQFYATGDIFIIDNKATRVFFLNKDLQNDLGMTSAYSLVLEGKWTYDAYFEMCEKATADLDGDGKMTRPNDRYGTMAQATLGGVLYLGSGESFTKKDADDIPYISCTNERAMTVMSVINEKLAVATSISQDGTQSIGSQPDNVYYFMEGRVLFAPEVLAHIETMRDCEVDIGILPAPKYEEAQEKYWCYADGYCVNVVSIPVTVTDTDSVGYVLESMSADSLNNLKPAYYDICLTKKYVRDPESVQMLDLIFDGVVMDNANIFSWGNLEGTVNSVLQNGGEIASALKKVEKVVAKTIDKTLSSLEKNAN